MSEIVINRNINLLRVINVSFNPSCDFWLELFESKLSLLRKRSLIDFRPAWFRLRELGDLALNQFMLKSWLNNKRINCYVL